jgi:hypothetical protein
MFSSQIIKYSYSTGVKIFLVIMAGFFIWFGYFFGLRQLITGQGYILFLGRTNSQLITTDSISYFNVFAISGMSFIPAMYLLLLAFFQPRNKALHYLFLLLISASILLFLGGTADALIESMRL